MYHGGTIPQEVCCMVQNTPRNELQYVRDLSWLWCGCLFSCMPAFIMSTCHQLPSSGQPILSSGDSSSFSFIRSCDNHRFCCSAAVMHYLCLSMPWSLCYFAEKNIINYKRLVTADFTVMILISYYISQDLTLGIDAMGRECVHVS